MPISTNLRCSDEISFSAHLWEKLDRNSSIGELIQVLLGIIFKRPRYIRSTDVLRYASMLHSFGKHIIPEELWGKHGGGPAEALPIGNLARALHRWLIDSFKSPHVFMVSLVLDTIEFIDAHCCGHSFSSPPGRIEPLLPEELADELRSRLAHVLDAQQKKDVTERNIGGVTVRACIPAGARMRTCRLFTGELPAGGSFIFTIRRCHLSQTSQSIHDEPYFLPEDRVDFDIASDFEFDGSIHIDKIPSDDSALAAIATTEAATRRLLPARAPFRWFTHIYRPAERMNGEFVPITPFGPHADLNVATPQK